MLSETKKIEQGTSHGGVDKSVTVFVPAWNPRYDKAMIGPAPYMQLLAAIPAFATLAPPRLQRLYDACALKVLPKGEAAVLAGGAVNELGILVSGRLTGIDPGDIEYGPGAAVEPGAFFRRQPARATAIALRETVLLMLGWEDFLDALRAERELLEALLAYGWHDGPQRLAPQKLSRLAVIPAGSPCRLDPLITEAILRGLENAGEIRLLSRNSFGGGLPGAITIDAPETAQWLQQLELEFDLTVTIAGGDEPDFAMEAIAEADCVLFVAAGGDFALSGLETHALETRGARNCRLLIVKGPRGAIRDPSDWARLRPYPIIQMADLSDSGAVDVFSHGILGKGHAVAAASRGAYAASILGALQALDAAGRPAVSLAAAGSAVLPAGLMACGAKPAFIDAIFRELANPLFWKRAHRVEACLFDPALLDHYLSGALRGFTIATAPRPFAALSSSLSRGKPVLHRAGPLYVPVRAGLTPQGIFPPLILEEGEILGSAESEGQALLDAAEALPPASPLYLRTIPPGLGASPMSYKTLAGLARFRLFKIETPPATPSNLRIETILGTGAPRLDAESVPSLQIVIPPGAGAMDWGQWERLRDSAFAQVTRELETRGEASFGTGVPAGEES